MVEFSDFIGLIGLILGLIIVFMNILSAIKLKGSKLFFIAIIFIFGAINMVIHSFVELYNYSEELYAFTALIVSILLAITMLIIYRSKQNIIQVRK